MSNVGYATLSVIPSAKGFGTALSRDVDPQMGHAGSSAGKGFGASLLSSAKAFAGPLAAAFSIGAGVKFFSDAVSGASDLSESASKVGVVFGAQSAQIMATAATSAAAMGLSKAAYLDATGGLGNLLVSLKVAPKAAADMSQQMVKLAGDMASFNNVSPEEALAAIQSGLTGETEPLKKFGVNMNDATLKAQALKMGLISSTKDAMDPQTKALAAQGLIMEQTGTAQGDFARTSGGLANQQRILAAQTEDLKTKVGTGLLPIVTTIVTFLNSKAIPAFTTIGGTIKDSVRLIAGSFTGAGADVMDLGKWTNPLIDFGAMLRNVFDTVKAKASDLWQILKPAFAAYGAAFAALMPILGPLIPQILSLASAFSPIRLIFTAIAPILPQIITLLGSLAATLGQALGQALGIILPIVTQLAGMLANELMSVIQRLLPVVMDLISVIGPILGTILQALMPIIGQVASVVMTLVTAFLPVVNLVIELVATLLPPLISLFMAILPPVLAVVGVIVSILVPVLKVVIEVISWVVQIVILALIAAFNDVMDVLPKVGDVFGKIGGWIKGGFNGVVDFVKGIFNTITGLVNGVIDGINSATSLAGAVGVKVAVIPHLPTLADGATILPSPGGTIVRVAEAGRAESVVDTGKLNRLLDRANGGGGDTYNIYEAVNPEATAMQVARRQNALAAV